MFSFAQKHLGPVKLGGNGRLGQMDMNAELQKFQAQQAAQPSITDLQSKLNTQLTQQSAQLQQAVDTASNLWWSMNWPYVAAAVAGLGLVGYLVFRKK